MFMFNSFFILSLSLSLIVTISSAWKAHFCLSDSTRRRAFDKERKSIACIRCNPNSCSKKDTPTNTHTKIQTPYQDTSRNSRLQTRMRELRSKLKEEATIIEKCLMANAASRREPTNPHETRKESPIFNPSNYQHKSYPHNRKAHHEKLEDLREALKMGNRSLHSTANQEYPIFQCRTERVSPMSRCASMRNHWIIHFFHNETIISQFIQRELLKDFKIKQETTVCFVCVLVRSEHTKLQNFSSSTSTALKNFFFFLCITITELLVFGWLVGLR